MNVRRSAAGIVVTLAAVALALALLRGGADDGRDLDRGSTAAEASRSPERPRSSSPSDASATGDTATGPTAEVKSSEPPAAGAPPTDGSDPGQGGIEAAPSPEQDRPLGEILAEQEQRVRAPVVSAPPRTTTAEGSLSPGHPRRVLPLVPGSDVVTSSVSPSEDRVQVAVVATGVRPEKVLGFYREQLTGLGFHEVDVSTAPGSEAAAFRWRRSSVVVTTGPDPAAYSIFATLLTGDA